MYQLPPSFAFHSASFVSSFLYMETCKHLAFKIQSLCGQPVVSYRPPVVCVLYLITFPLEILIEMKHKSLLFNG